MKIIKNVWYFDALRCICILQRENSKKLELMKRNVENENVPYVLSHDLAHKGDEKSKRESGVLHCNDKGNKETRKEAIK